MVDRKAYPHNQILSDIGNLRGLVASFRQRVSTVALTATGSATLPATTVSGSLQVTPSASGFQGYAVIAKTDHQTFTVTQAAQTRITNNYTIPANDANNGTWYRITAFGSGTQGSTQQSLSFFIENFATNSAGFGFATTAVAASTGFEWELEGYVLVTSIGASGNARYGNKCQLRQAAANSGISLNAYTNNVTVDTTTAGQMSVSAQWGSTTGAPTVTCFGSMLERIGP